MEIYIKTDNKLKQISSITSLKDFREIVTRVTDLENKVNQMQTLLDQQS